jgi:predicted RNase H-like HicB family nuclease
MTGNSPRAGDRAYRVVYSLEDGEFVGLCDEFPSLSWLARDERSAMEGIRQLIEEVLHDPELSTAQLPKSSSSSRAH